MTSDADPADRSEARPSWLRRLWFFLLLLFRRIARLFGVAERARRVAPPPARSFDFERAPEGPPFTEVNHPILRTLRRRALNDLFDWLELDFVPGPLLERSDHSSDPVAAFTTFLRSVGCDPERVRRREPEELERLRSVVDLLMAFGSLTARLDGEQRDRLQLLLMSGDFERLRGAAERLFVLAAILDGHEALEAARPLAGYEALVGHVRPWLGRLLELPTDEVEAAAARAERWRRLALRRDLLERKIEAAFAALGRAETRAPRDADRARRRDRLAARHQEIDAHLTTDPGLDPAAVAALLEELDALLAEVQTLLRAVEAEAEEAARFDSQAASERVYRTELDAALGFFGFAPEARPERAAVRAAWRRYMKDNHPDLTTEPAEKRRREARCKEANLKRDRLHRELGL